MTDNWANLSIQPTPSFILEMNKLIQNHDKNFGYKLGLLRKSTPLFDHIIQKLESYTHDDFLTHTKTYRVFELVISTLINSDDAISQIDDRFTEKINDFQRVFSHLSYNHNPRLGLLFLYLYSNNQQTPDLFCQKVISLVNPNSTHTRVEEVDVYLFSLWLLKQKMSEKEIERHLEESTPLSKILQSSTGEFKNYFYSEMAKYLCSINELFHFTQKRV